MISTQVLSEFFITVTRKISFPLTPTDAYQRVANYVTSWEVIDLTGAIVLDAIRGVRDYQLSIWDRQIWAAARLNQISVAFSENFNTGSILEAVEFVNPFAVDFQLIDWI